MKDQTVEKGGASFSRTCFNAINGLIGIGLIVVPYTLAQGGWFSLFFLLAMATITCYTGIMIGRCMDSNASIKTYTDMIQHIFGKTGNIFWSILMYLELFLVPTGFLILEGDNLHKLFPDVVVKLGHHHIGGKQFFILAAGIAVLPSMWLRDLSWLSYVSAAGVFSSIIIIVSIFCVGAFDGVGFSSRGELFKLVGIPTAVSVYAYCYGSHPVFPNLYSSMRHNRHFSKVLYISFGFCTLCYISIAVIGYLMFGRNALSQITLNLPAKKLSSKVAIYTTLVSPIAKYALIITPIATALEACLPIQYRHIFIFLLLRSLLLASSVILALVFPYFGILIAFIGSVLNVTISILVPCISFLKICKAHQKWDLESVVVMVIVGLAVLTGVLGTFSSVRDSVKQI